MVGKSRRPSGNPAGTTPTEDAESQREAASVMEESSGAPKGMDVPDPEKEQKSKQGRVTYHGRGTRREVTEDQWKRAGVEDQGTLVWSRENGYSVSVDDLSESALSLLRQDPTIRVN